MFSIFRTFLGASAIFLKRQVDNAEFRVKRNKNSGLEFLIESGSFFVLQRWTIEVAEKGRISIDEEPL